MPLPALDVLPSGQDLTFINRALVLEDVGMPSDQLAGNLPEYLLDPERAFLFRNETGHEKVHAEVPQFLRHFDQVPFFDGSVIESAFLGGGEYAGNSVTYTSDATERTRVLWMSLLLENEGGTWTSRPDTMGVWADGSVIPVWFDGSGGYEGLSAFVLNTVEEYDSGHASLQYEGWILPDTPTS